MPSSSKKQHDFMNAIAHNKTFAKKTGVPQSVGKDFSEADKSKKFAGGGRADRQVINKKKTDHGQLGLFKGGGMATNAKMKMQKPQGISKKSTMPEQNEMGMMGMKKGGAACAPMKKGGMPKKMAKGGGIESKGKTKGKVC
jgi:hypothetical protein